jgi:hypothetical protein
VHHCYSAKSSKHSSTSKSFHSSKHHYQQHSVFFRSLARQDTEDRYGRQSQGGEKPDRIQDKRHRKDLRGTIWHILVADPMERIL